MHHVVSIRARHRWRAIRGRLPDRADRARRFNPRPPSMAGDPPEGPRRAPVFQLFQSAPAIDGGRSGHGVGRQTARLPVSIRARHRWRAIQGLRPRRARPVSFQSAPAIDGGRSSLSFLGMRCRMLFQSAPAIDGGRSPGTRPRQAARARVSIRARHRWRAIHSEPEFIRVARGVSIRARHRWRAIP